MCSENTWSIDLPIVLMGWMNPFFYARLCFSVLIVSNVAQLRKTRFFFKGVNDKTKQFENFFTANKYMQYITKDIAIYFKFTFLFSRRKKILLDSLELFKGVGIGLSVCCCSYFPKNFIEGSKTRFNSLRPDFDSINLRFAQSFGLV